MAELDHVSMQVLRELCMDSRASIETISKKVGHSRDMVRRRISFLEKEVGLRYVAEIDERKLGVSFPTIIYAKLKRSIEGKKLALILGEDGLTQFAALGKGNFDLLIYATAANQLEFIRWEHRIRSTLNEYISSWKSSQVAYYRLGFFPLTEKFLLSLPLPDFQRKLLALLHANARAGFRELASKLSCPESTVRYQISQLQKTGIVKRFTAVMEKPTSSVQLAIFSEYTFTDDFEEKSKRARALIFSEPELISVNKRCMMAELAGASDAFLLGSFDEVQEAYSYVKEREDIFGGAEYAPMETSILLEKVIGLWPLRSMDLRSTYDTSSWDKVGVQ